MIQNGAGDGHTLLLATRQFVGHLKQLLVQSYLLHHFADAVVDGIVIFPTCGLEHKAQVFIYGAVAEQLEVLEHHAQVAAQARNIFAADGLQVAIQHDSLVGLVNIQFAVECLQERTFTRAYATNHVNHLALVNLKVHPLEHLNARILVNVYILIINQHSIILFFAKICYFIFPAALASRRCLSQLGSWRLCSSSATCSIRKPLLVSSTVR